MLIRQKQPVDSRTPAGPGANITLDAATRMLREAACDVGLTRQESQLLQILASASGGISSERLLQRLYPAQEPVSGPNVLRVVISHIRGKIKRAGLRPLIWNRSEFGYGLSRPVAVIHTPEPPLILPARLGALLAALLHSHPNQIAAGRVLRWLER